MGDFFIKKALHLGKTFLSKFMGGCFTWGLMIRSCKGGWEIFTNVFSSNLNTVNLKNFPDHGG